MIVPTFTIHGGKCAEAIDLYKKAFALEVHSIAYERDNPEHNPETEDGSLIMHAAGEMLGSRVEFSDSEEPSHVTGNNLCLHAYLESNGEVIRAFDTLKIGATVEEAPAPQFWNALYARLIDKFGIKWHLMVKDKG
jgi:PhnB protein